MKNQTTKFNKSKLVARGMLVVFLMTTIFNLVGCSLGYIGYNYYKTMETDGIHSRPASIRVKSKTNTFNIENLTLDLDIGVHRTSFFGVMDNSPKEQYAFPSYNIGFAIYICDGQYENSFPYYVDNLENIENHYFIDEITEEEAFTKEYAYGGFGYNHQRKIKIPRECLSEKTGSIAIKLANYYEFDEQSDGKEFKYKFEPDYSIYTIVLEYEKMEDSLVRITNFYE